MLTRQEKPEDRDAVHAIHRAAFGSPAEAQLVDVLREVARPNLSLVAEDSAHRVAGHILFTPVTLAGESDPLLMGLAPMAVHPDDQRSGVGSALVCAGLNGCRDLGAVGCVVLGHPEYYRRFGFVPSRRFGIDSEYAVPEEVFMAMELVSGALEERSGRVQYHSAFGGI